MEYILINERKLKVMLESEDLDELSLSADQLDYSNPEAKRLFGDILGYAKDEFGFNTEGYRILLQLYPSKVGGCEIFITKLGILSSDGEGNNTTDKTAPSVTPYSEKKERSDIKKKEKKQRAYRFSHIDHLLFVCKKLLYDSFDGESQVWRDGRGDWFLILSGDHPDEIFDLLPLNELSFISEYGHSENARAILLYLAEYGNLLYKSGAVEALGNI